MKRFISGIAVLLSVVSCLEGAENKISETLNLTFEGAFSDDFFGADSVYAETPFMCYSLLVFSNKVDKTDEGDPEFKGGFALSCLSGDVPEPVDEKSGEIAEEPASINPFRAYAPLGSENTYTVYFQSDDMPEHGMFFNASNLGTCVMSSCYVNNTVEVVDYVRKNFATGDRIILKATGSLGGEKTGSAEMYLADYSWQKDSVVTRWTFFDLSKLGSIDAVDFEITSSKEIPTRFCMDKIVATVSLSY